MKTVSSRPLGYCASQVDSPNTGSREQNLLSLSYGNIIRKDITGSDGLLPESFETYNVVEPGDTVLRLTDLQNDQRSLRVGFVQERGIITSAYVTLRPQHDVDQRFFSYVLKSMDFRKDFYALGAGVRQSLKFDELKRVQIHLPAINKQRAITSFLDRETARIDALIEKKRRMVELLDEKSRRTISELTRRGLNPSIAQADSGLPWVGKIPSHWEIVPNRRTLRIVRRPVILGREPTLLSLTKRGVIVRDVSENFGKYPASFDTYQIVHNNELVFCLFDVPETPRTVGLSEQTGMITGAYVVAAPKDEVSPEFIRYLYEGFDDEKSLSLFYTGLRKVIRPDTFLGIRMPLPPADEQCAIVSELNRVVRSLKAAGRCLSDQIRLLREHRQALITAAVSGELEIPEVAA